MQQESLFILAVALITWGGVFAYLLRLNFLAKEIEAKVDRQQPDSPDQLPQ